MTEQEQTNAIAEACGWTWETRKHPAPCWHHGDFFTGAPLFYEPRKKEDYYHHLPDYLSDLNAMHGAEKVLSESERKAYANEIMYRCTTTGEWDYDPMDKFRMLHLTAEQRAEAFLRTLNLWKD